MGRKKQVKPLRGRKEGKGNKGYWFRAGRGWCATEGNKAIPLLDADGNRITAPDAIQEAEEAYFRYRLGLDDLAKREAIGDTALVLRVCQDYLDYAKQNNRASTYTKRGEFLFDFCFGLSAKFWDYGKGRSVPKPTEADYLHKGYGSKAIGELIPMHVQQWLDVHKGWGASTRRMAVQSVKRAFNYGKQMGLIAVNPVASFKVGVGQKRITYFNPEVEEALYKHARRPLATAIKVLIRTGVRPMSEFAKLTAKHVDDTDPKCMVWRFKAEEAKTNKPRTIFVPSDIAELTRELMRRYPRGALFRNAKRQPWVANNLRSAFSRLKKRLASKGIKMNASDCPYSCRHTYAKRMLGGYWSGKPITIEVLAGLMGNSRAVCWEHYAGWCEGYTDPLRDAINGL